MQDSGKDMPGIKPKGKIQDAYEAWLEHNHNFDREVGLLQPVCAE